jgi:hypothetical protein
MQTFRVTASTGTPDDEWIATGMNEIAAVVGWAIIGEAAGTAVFMLNGNGTGDDEGDVGGSLGIECDDERDIIVTVLGD